MDHIDEAIAALREGAYERAHGVLDGLAGGKAGTAVRIRALWTIAQILRRSFDDDAVTGLIEVARRSPNRAGGSYDRVMAVTGPLEDLVAASAAQELRLRIGDYFLRDEKPGEAIGWVAAALSAGPNDPIAIYLEANCRFALYGEPQAIADMELVLERAAADTDRAYLVGGRGAAFYYRLGLAYERVKDLGGAAAYFRRAVERDPDNETPRVMLGEVLVRLGRFEEAIGLLATVERYADGYRFAARLHALALFGIGKVDEALALLHEVAEIDPLWGVAFLEMGRIYLAQGNYEQAEIALARAFRTNPDLAGLGAAIATLERHVARYLDPDAGMPAMTAFEIPPEFAPRLDDPDLHQRASMKVAVGAFLRVLQTLMIRDMLVLYSHSGMGYLWALAQPLVFIGSLVLVYSVSGHQPPLGLSPVAFFAVGIVPYLSFYVRVEAAVSSAVRSNLSLLYFRQVTPLALISAAFVREYLTALVVFVIIAGSIACFDKSVQISDPLEILAAVTCIALLAAVIGTFFGLGELVVPSLQLLEIFVFRVMFFFSGALFFANQLPPQMRKYALLNPLLHLIEFVRDGYLSVYRARYASWSFALECISVGIVLMVVLLHATRRYVVAT